MASFFCAWNWWGVVLLLAAQHGVLISPAKTLNKNITASFSSFVPSSFSFSSSSSSSLSSSFSSSSSSSFSSSSSSLPWGQNTSTSMHLSSSQVFFPTSSPSMNLHISQTPAPNTATLIKGPATPSSPTFWPAHAATISASISHQLTSPVTPQSETPSPPMNLHTSQTPAPNIATLIKGPVTPSSPTFWPAHAATISAVSHSETPSPHSVSSSLNSISLLTTTVSPSTRPTGVTMTTNFKLILYIAPPLLVVVVVAIAISLCLCIKRYRRIRRYRLQLLPLHDMDGSDVDSEEDEEEREEENGSEREPVFTLQHQARPILAFEDSS